MESNFAKVLDSEVFVDLKRNRAAELATNLSRASRNIIVSRHHTLKLGKRKKPDVCKARCKSCKPTHHRSSPRNYTNFMKSGVPKRLMSYQHGGWVDHEPKIITLIRKEFELKRAAVEVKLGGDHLIFDFVRMVQFDFRTALELPVAWIDEDGGCFFPDVYTNVGKQYRCFHYEKPKEELPSLLAHHSLQEIKLQIEIEVDGVGDDNFVECCGETNPLVKRTKVGQITDVEDNFDEVSNTRLNEEVRKNTNSEKRAYTNDVEKANLNFDDDTVMKMFGVGVNKTDGVNLVGIRSNSGSMSERRLELFLKQVQITRKYRGDANVRYAWLESTKEASSGIMAYGLSHFGFQQIKSAYGIGVHLAPANCAYTSANYCDVDENGVRYMVLCRVILGNMEMVHAGSKQFHPSSDNFDSGVDDPKNPLHYVVWSMNINSHIYPEYVVSFKVPTDDKGSVLKYGGKHEKLRVKPVHESAFNQTKVGAAIDMVSDHRSNLTSISKETTINSLATRLPRSPWIPFPVLFAAISKQVHSSDMKTVLIHYEQFRKKVISRENFVTNLRLTVGDAILKTTIIELNKI
ncbi:hypothetical protein RND81_10G179000 [Saponaria officinalis]|uniref:Poly [ADP-ribose] polymerase n=1 Tax=Saponaria officinalis TaxID=3572 RepID=A0AAW1I515_SAPOF